MTVFSIITILILFQIAAAQNPCSEIGSDCRLMTTGEVKALKERILAVKALLPVPDVNRYIHNGAAEASTMPFIAESNIPNAALTYRAWPLGSFVEYPYNTLLFGYSKKSVSSKTNKKSKDVLEATNAMMAEFENQIELSVTLLPYSYLVYQDSDPDAINLEKSVNFLSWETGDENIELHMIFGPRTTKESETLILDKPVKNFAPVKAIELIISGPKAEVAELKKKIDRKTFYVLLGTVVK